MKISPAAFSFAATCGEDGRISVFILHRQSFTEEKHTGMPMIGFYLCAGLAP